MARNENEKLLVEEIRRQVIQKYRFEPNLLPKLLISPQVAQIYLNGFGFLEKSSLTPVDIQVAALVASVNNTCSYCSGAHAALGVKMGVSKADVDLIRAGTDPAEPRLTAVARAVRQLMETRGFLRPEDLAEHENAGIARRQIHELIAIIALKTITNYINHMESTKLNPEFLQMVEQAGVAAG